MSFLVVFDRPVFDMIQVVQSEIYIFRLLLWDFGEKCTSEYSDSGRNIISRLVKDDKFGKCLTRGDFDLILETIKPFLYLNPTALIWFMITKDQKYYLEDLELTLQGGKKAVVFDISDIAEEAQLGSLRGNLEDIVLGGRF